MKKKIILGVVFVVLTAVAVSWVGIYVPTYGWFNQTTNERISLVYWVVGLSVFLGGIRRREDKDPVINWAKKVFFNFLFWPWGLAILMCKELRDLIG